MRWSTSLFFILTQWMCDTITVGHFINAENEVSYVQKNWLGFELVTLGMLYNVSNNKSVDDLGSKLNFSGVTSFVLTRFSDVSMFT